MVMAGPGDSRAYRVAVGLDRAVELCRWPDHTVLVSVHDATIRLQMARSVERNCRPVPGSRVAGPRASSGRGRDDEAVPACPAVRRMGP